MKVGGYVDFEIDYMQQEMLWLWHVDQFKNYGII